MAICEIREGSRGGGSGWGAVGVQGEGQGRRGRGGRKTGRIRPLCWPLSGTKEAAPAQCRPNDPQ